MDSCFDFFYQIKEPSCTENLSPGSLLSALPFAGEGAGASLVALHGQVLQTLNPFQISRGIFQSLGKTLWELKDPGCVPRLLCSVTLRNFFLLFLLVSVIYVLGAELRGTGLFPGGRASHSGACSSSSITRFLILIKKDFQKKRIN